jgi:hypothetical protein
MFVEGGVCELSSDFQKAESPAVLWAFVDTDGNQEGIPAHLTVHCVNNLFVI